MAAVSDKVRSSVATEAKSLNFGTSARAKTNDACLKLVKKESDLPAAHEMLDDKSTFEFYVNSISALERSYLKYILEKKTFQVRWYRLLRNSSRNWAATDFG